MKIKNKNGDYWNSQSKIWGSKETATEFDSIEDLPFLLEDSKNDIIAEKTIIINDSKLDVRYYPDVGDLIAYVV